jgi:uncharacterized protein
MIIDGDGHIVEPPTLWKEHLASDVHDRVYMEYGDDGLAKRLILDEFSVDVSVAGDSYNPGGYRKEERIGRPLEAASPGAWDPRARLAVHDIEHIDAAVLFPSYGLAVPGLSDERVAIATSRAVNDWLAEYCGEAPHELYGVATLPAHHPDAAAAELRRCVEQYGFVAGFVRPAALRDGRTLRHESFEPIWRAADDLDVAITVHNAGWPNELHFLAQQRTSSFMLAHSAAHTLEAMTAFGELYESRMFDRHPRLRVGFMESGCGWSVPWVERLEEHREMMGWTLEPPLDRPATDIFATQCAVGCEGEEVMAPYVVRYFGADVVVWASDYPHLDTSPPFIDDMMNRTDLSTSERDSIMRAGSVRLYQLDEGAIERSVAARQKTPAVTPA